MGDRMGSSPINRTKPGQAIKSLLRFFYEKRCSITPLFVLSAKSHALLTCSAEHALEKTVKLPGKKERPYHAAVSG